MLQALLEIFTTEQKAREMLESPIIEGIFLVLFVLFIMTFIVHFSIYFKLRRIRHYVKQTGRMDIAPLADFQQAYERNDSQSIQPDTFVQEKFSGWRMFHIPVVSLIKMVQMTVSVFILIGVLGTFIGLTMSLGSIDTGSDELVENVAAVLGGIDVAFYTSIIGMSFSLLMTLLVKMFNTEYMLTDIMLMVESNLEEDSEAGMGQMIKVSESIHQAIVDLQSTNQASLENIEQAFDGFKDYTEGLQQSAEDLAAFNEGLSDNLVQFTELFQQMKLVTDGFEEGTTTLNENFNQLFAYFKKMDATNERIAQSFEKTHEKIAKTTDKQIEALESFSESTKHLETFTSESIAKQEAMQQSMDSVLDKSGELVEKMDEHQQTFKEVFGEDLSRNLHGIMTYLQELKTGFDQLGGSITKLPDALALIHQAQGEYKHLIQDRMKELQEFSQTFHRHLQTHKEETAAFERHLSEASRSQEQVSGQNHALLRELNQTIAGLDQAFHQRENYLEQSVNSVQETLNSYMRTLEATLSDRLDKVARNILDMTKQTNDQLQAEISDWKKTSESVETTNARNLQQTLEEFRREVQGLHRLLDAGGGQLPQPGSGMNRYDP